MEVLLAFYIVWRIFKMFEDINTVAESDMALEDMPAFVYGRQLPQRDRQSQQPQEQPKKQPKKKRFTITEPDEDRGGPTIYTLDGGTLDDDDELIYPE